MEKTNLNLIQSDQQNPERDSTGETSLAKLSIEEDGEQTAQLLAP